MKIVALVAVRNEEDVIVQTVSDLIEQGVEVYLLDDGSTDGTVERVQHLEGKGIIAIESLPHSGPGSPDRFQWRAILKRKQELAASLSADWFIHHDADEIREPPWPDTTLAHALETVDRLGWNAVDFALLNFQPTSDDFPSGGDLRRAFGFFEPSQQPWDRLQIRCWKAQPAVDLLTSGGHDVRFENRRVFPIRFILRHYPIRTQQQGFRKVFIDRIPRFDESERAIGWHVQYAHLREDHTFVRSPDALTAFDAERVRIDAQIEHRGVEALRQQLAEMASQLAASQLQLDEARQTAAEELRTRKEFASQVELCRAANEDLRRVVDGLRTELRTVRESVETQQIALETRVRELAEARAQGELWSRRTDEILSSRTWRWSAPVRRLVTLFARRTSP